MLSEIRSEQVLSCGKKKEASWLQKATLESLKETKDSDMNQKVKQRTEQMQNVIKSCTQTSKESIRKCRYCGGSNQVR